MANKSFIPVNDSELRTWANNFKVQLQNNPTNLGLDATAINTLSTMIDDMNATIDNVVAKEDAYRSAVRQKETTKEATLAALRRYTASIKSHINYTDSLGATLGLITPPATAPDWNNLKPSPKIKKTVQGVEIAYSKKGADGVLVYCKRGTETEFTRVEKDTSSPFEDNRPNLNGAVGENRQYYLVYFKNDAPIGLQSDIVSVLV